MATFGQIIDNIESYLNKAGLTSAIEDAVKKAVEHYQREVFWFSESSASFVTSSGTQDYTLSTTDGYSAIHSVIVNSNGARYEVDRRNADEITAIDASGSLGVPNVYAEVNGLVRFYPTPNATMTVSVVYATRYATLSATTDYNAFTTNAQDLIESRAEWFIRAKKLRDYNGAQVAKENELEALAQLRIESDKKISSGRITPTKF